MMPQNEGSSARQKLADPEYGRYEENHTGGSRHQYETAYAQDVREGPSGKVYPLPRDKTNILRFTLTVIALGLILLFGLLFVVVIGGTTGWASFVVACLAILLIAGVGINSVK
jgi:hypothetical protein